MSIDIKSKEYTYESAKRAYENDPAFYGLVNTMMAMIHHLEMTPSDLRAAANFAWMLHDQRTVRRSMYFEVPNRFDAQTGKDAK